MDTTFRRTAPMTNTSALGFATRAHCKKEQHMRVHFVPRSAGPERLLAEAELHFDGDGPLAGMRLVGFSLWRGSGTDTYVTFPSRIFGAGQERRYFNYLRGDAETVERFKAFVIDAFGTWVEQGGNRETLEDDTAAAPPDADTGKRPARKRKS